MKIVSREYEEIYFQNYWDELSQFLFLMEILIEILAIKCAITEKRKDGVAQIKCYIMKEK